MANWFKIVKKSSSQTQKEFEQSVRSHYDAFSRDFFVEGGTYYPFFKVLLDSLSKGETDEGKFVEKTRVYVKYRVEEAVAVARVSSETCEIDSAYFIELYQKYINSNKTETFVRQIGYDFFGGLNALSREIENLYDKVFPSDKDAHIKYFRRESGQSLEDYKDVFCDEYNLFLEDFIISDGVYSGLFIRLLSFYADKGENEETRFRTRVNRFVGDKISPMIDMSKQGKQLPCPNLAYYRELYRQWRASDKTDAELEKIKDKFVFAYNDLHREVDYVLDNEMPDLYEDQQTKVMQKTKSQSQEEFKDEVCNEYNAFLEDFLIPEGCYADVYFDIANWLEEKQGKAFLEDKTREFARLVSLKMLQAAKEKNEVPVLNPDHYRASYRQYQASKKTPENKEQFANDFIAGYQQVIRKLDEILAKGMSQKPSDYPCVITIKKTSGQTNAEFDNKVRGIVYSEFISEFCIDLGVYVDMFNAMIDYCKKYHKYNYLLVKTRCNLFTQNKTTLFSRLAHKTDQIPCPNYAYFRALYKEYEKSDKSPKVMEKLTLQFVAALNELIRQVEAVYDKVCPGDIVSRVQIIKKAKDQSRGDFEKGIVDEYNTFYYNFRDPNGAYGDMYSAILNNAKQKGKDTEDKVMKILQMSEERADKINSIKKQKDKMPCPNSAYYRELYRQLLKPNKDINEISDNFLKGVEELANILDEYDKLPNGGKKTKKVKDGGAS